MCHKCLLTQVRPPEVPHPCALLKWHACPRSSCDLICSVSIVVATIVTAAGTCCVLCLMHVGILAALPCRMLPVWRAQQPCPPASSHALCTIKCETLGFQAVQVRPRQLWPSMRRAEARSYGGMRT